MQSMVQIDQSDYLSDEKYPNFRENLLVCTVQSIQDRKQLLLLSQLMD